MRALLEDDTMLGRLGLSLVDGLDESGKISELFAFGGRSVTLFKYVLLAACSRYHEILRETVVAF